MSAPISPLKNPPHFERHPDDEWYDEVRIVTVPRYKTSGLSGDEWRFTSDQLPITTIRGEGADLCLVAARRVDARETSLTGDGPDAAAVLELVRTYA